MKRQELALFEKQDLVYFVERLMLGLKEIAAVHEKLKVFEPEVFTDVVSGEIQKLTQNIESFKRTALDLLIESEENRAVKELLGISDATMRALYRISAEIYNETRFKEAAAAFSVITLLDPMHHDAWIALGNADSFCKRYRGALIAYAMATLANPNNPFSHIYSAYCYEKLQEYDSAIHALDLALFVMDKNPEYNDLVLKVKEHRERQFQVLVAKRQKNVL